MLNCYIDELNSEWGANYYHISVYDDKRFLDKYIIGENSCSVNVERPKYGFPYWIIEIDNSCAIEPIGRFNIFELETYIDEYRAVANFYKRIKSSRLYVFI
jgi:hypothetical protein